MKSSPSFTDKKLFISLNSVGIILTAIATLCISLAISTFFISKKYRSHPGSLVLGLCFSELFRYYANFWIMEETLASLTTEQGFNFFERTSCWFKELSFGILDPGENNLYTMTSCISAMCLEIGNIYYMFISVDIFLLLRNPFYSPKRRIFLYHVIAISLPLSIFLPLRILDEEKTLAVNQDLPTRSLTAQYFDIGVQSMVAIICFSSLLLSWVKMKQINMSKSQKRAFLTKMVAYSIVGLLCSIFSMGEDYCLIRIGHTKNNNWLIGYIECFLMISTCGICILPIRIAEPLVYTYLRHKISLICCLNPNSQYKSQIKEKIFASNTYYSFVQTSINGQLAKSILQGVIAIITKNELVKTKISEFSRTELERSRMVESLLSPSRTSLQRKSYTGIRSKSEMPRSISHLGEESVIRERMKVEIKGVQTFEIEEQTVQITQFAPNLFKHIKNCFSIRNQDILYSLDPDNNQTNIFSVAKGEGKSGSFFISTFDQKFLIKTAFKEELQTFIKILPEYAKYITEIPESLLSKIVGAFSIKMKGFVPVYFIIMENSLPKMEEYNLKYTFDLKGSRINRSVEGKLRSGKTFKDLNFLKFKATNSFNPETEYISKYRNILRKDVGFLWKKNIMDYSLLVGIGRLKAGYQPITIPHRYKQRFIMSREGRYIYFFCIIDYFQEYSLIKKLERVLKVLRSPTAAKYLSVIPPKYYAHRFLNFMYTNIFG